MYEKLLENNYYNTLKENAIGSIKKERDNPYFDIIFKFADDNNFMISDTCLILDALTYRDKITMYGNDLDAKLKELMKILCKEENDLFMLRVSEINKEYFIEYNLRRICMIFASPVFDKYNIYDFMPFDKGHKMIPPIIEIIDELALLYNPLLFDKWGETLENVKRLNTLIWPNIISGKKQQKKCKGPDLDDIILEFIKDNNFVLLNGRGYSAYGRCIEIISASDIEKDFILFVDYLSKNVAYSFVYEQADPFILKDPFIKKYNVYVQIPCTGEIQKRRVLTIYNNANYELIFYKDFIYKVADPIIELRFLFIQLWHAIITAKIRDDDITLFIAESKTAVDKTLTDIDIQEKKDLFIGNFLDKSVMNKLRMLAAPKYKSSYNCLEI